MSEQFEVIFYGDVINCVRDETGKEYNLHELINLLMNQQDTIDKLQKDNIELKKLRKYCAEWMGVKEENLYDVVR